MLEEPNKNPIINHVINNGVHTNVAGFFLLKPYFTSLDALLNALEKPDRLK